MSAKDGGPAFPRPFSGQDAGSWVEKYDSQEGMSLRDYFAGQAMAGVGARIQRGNTLAMEDLASTAYRIADAMLKAREEGR